MGIFKDFKNFFIDKDDKEKSNSKILIRNLLIMGVIGCIFLFAGNLFSNPGQPSNDKKTVQNNIHNNYEDKNSSYEITLKTELEETISLIKGVGRVKVQVIFSRSSDYQYEYNQNEKNKITNETDQNGGERRIEEDSMERELVIIRDVDGSEKPVIKMKRKPEISGVMIVAEGADSSKVKYEIHQAVSSLLNLPIHKLSVLPYHKGGK